MFVAIKTARYEGDVTVSLYCDAGSELSLSFNCTQALKRLRGS